MLAEIGLIAGGIPAGWLTRRSEAVVKVVNRCLGWTVRAMLFLLGLSIGGNDELLAQMEKFGLCAAVISSLSVLGCLAAARLLGRYVFPEYAPCRVGHAPRLRSCGGTSLAALAFFAAGVFSGLCRVLPAGLSGGEAVAGVLYVLLFLAGMTVGFDLRALSVIREFRVRILLIPLGVAAGTFCGSLLGGFLLSLKYGITLIEALAVGAGFGYYSLATVILTRLGDPALGSVALLSNMMHEALALLLSPLLLRFSGGLGPVLAGGATAMDTCLPVIASVSGERCAILAMFSGVCLTLAVPVILPLLMALR